MAENPSHKLYVATMEVTAEVVGHEDSTVAEVAANLKRNMENAGYVGVTVKRLDPKPGYNH